MKKYIYIIATAVLVCFAVWFSQRNNDENYNYSNAVQYPIMPEDLHIENYKEPIVPISNETGITITDHSYDHQFLIADDYSFSSASSDCMNMYRKYGAQRNTECIVLYDKNTNDINGFEFRYIGDKSITEEGGN